MCKVTLMVMASSLASPGLAHELAELLPGTFTNTEESYFQGEAGEQADPWLGVNVTANESSGWRMQRVDAFGEPRAHAHDATIEVRGDLTALRIDDCTRLFRPEGEDFVLASSEGSCGDSEATGGVIARVSESGLTLQGPGGRTVNIRRARPLSCWLSVRKTEEVAEGESEWTFDDGLMMHDQGGRVCGGGDSGAPETIIRMRNVVWPAPSRNRPSLVLYVHTADDPVSAVSYSWADSTANRVGINLRWMQASCTVQTEGDE